MAIELTEEQRLAAFAQGGDLLVSAAAGSGKTRVLVERLISRVCGEEQRDVDEFLVLTFTKAAAGEMRGRILKELSDRLAREPGNAHLRRQMTLVYQADITTIDAYCAALVRENAHLCGLTGDFRIAEETETILLRDQILEELIEERYESGDPEFLKLCDTLALGRDDRKLREIVLSVYASLQSHAEPMVWVDQMLRNLDPGEILEISRTPWGRELMEHAGSQARLALSLLEDASTVIEADPALRKAYGETFAQDGSDAAALCAATKQENWDKVVAALGEIQPGRLPGLRGYEDKALQERLKASRNRWKDILEDLRKYFSTPEEEVIEDLRAIYPLQQALFGLVREFDARFREEKRRRGLAEFSDLEQAAAALLTQGDGGKSELAQQLATRYIEVMVDEYQDINECQDAILTALGRDDLFYVGDMKQSIYRFRMADPRIFLKKYLTYPQTDSLRLHGPAKTVMSQNFRSRGAVLEAVNFLFRRIMRPETGELAYTEDQALHRGRDYPGKDPAPELLLADCAGGPDGSRQAGSVPQSEARIVARRIRQLLDEGAAVTGEDGTLRPVEPGDIVILLRSPAGRGALFQRELQALGIPCVSPSREEHWTGVERAVPLSLLQCVDNPRQDIPLAGALRSPVFAFTPDELVQIREADPTGCFYDALQAARETSPKAERFCAFLEKMRLLAPDLTVEQLLRRIYDETGLPALVGAMPDGDRRRQDLEALLDMARDFEKTSYKGLFSFLRFLETQIESGKGLNTASAETTPNAVRIMSIHHSKGLEFPVVFLSGLGTRFNRQDLSDPVLLHPELGAGFRRLDQRRMLEWDTEPRYAIAMRKDRELLAEEMRLLYVAMTRATERLILSAGVANLRRAVEKAASGYVGGKLASQEISAVSSAVFWVLQALVSSPDGREALDFSDPLGLPGETERCGWRIQITRMANQAETGFAPEAAGEQREAVPADPENVARVRGMLDWRYPYEASEELPSKVTATQLKGRYLDQEAAQDAGLPAPTEPAPLRRPAFLQEDVGLTPAEKGTAAHLAMQFLDFSRCVSMDALKKELETLLERRLLTKAQFEAVDPRQLWRFFGSSLGKRVQESERVLREFKFSLLTKAETWFAAGAGEELLLQGVIDCAFLEDGGWTVLDFKTDRILPGGEARRAEHYALQLETYAQALLRITGIPVVGKVVYFFATGGSVELRENM